MQPFQGRFEGKVACVTGAAGGIGAATAERLALEGARVLCLDVQGDRATETAEKIASAGGSAVGGQVDVASSAECTEVVDYFVAEQGRLDVLCNVAGILRANHTAEVDDEEWNLLMNVNLNGPFYMSRAAIPHLLETKGAIINVSSTAGLIGQAYLTGYCASKHGLIGMTRAMAVEYAHTGMRVNAVCPGGTKTDLTADIAFPDDADFDLIMRAALKVKPGSPWEIAGLLAYAASDEARYVNGAVLSIDSGVTAG